MWRDYRNDHCPSVCHSIRLCVNHTSWAPSAYNIFYRILLKFWRVSSFFLYEDVHVVMNFWSTYFWHNYSPCELRNSNFKACVHNSPYIFYLILLKFRMFSFHYMKICMWFWIVKPVLFKVIDEALLAETAHYCPYPYNKIYPLLLKTSVLDFYLPNIG